MACSTHTEVTCPIIGDVADTFTSDVLDPYRGDVPTQCDVADPFTSDVLDPYRGDVPDPR